MRQRKTFRIDTSLLGPARERAGLPADAPEGAVVRYALAVLAGVDPTDHIDWQRGYLSVSYRERMAREARHAA